LKPTLAPDRLVKSSLEPSPFSQARDGGLSSTPSLTRWLHIFSEVPKFSAVNGLPIDSRNRLPQMLFGLLDFQATHMTIDAPSFLESWDSPTHPTCTSGQLIVRSKNRPVQSIFEGNFSVNRTHGFSFQICLSQRSRAICMSICISIRMAIRVTVGISICIGTIAVDFSP